MNVKLYILLSLFLVNSVHAEFLPSSWYSPLNNLKNIDNNDNPSEKTNRSYQNIIDTKFSLIEKSIKNNKKNKWYLQSVKSEIGIESVGSFGMFGLKGETAVEFVWIRTKKSKDILHRTLAKKENNISLSSENIISDEVEDNSSPEHSLNVDPQVSKDQIENIVSSIGESLYASGKIKEVNNFKDSLTKELVKFSSVARALELQDETRPWRAYKYQIEFLVEASGQIVPVLKGGLGVRLRLEWYRSKKARLNKSLLSSKDLLNADFINALSEDLSKIDTFQISKTKYDLNYLKVGVGVGAKGSIYIAKAKGHVIGSVFFKRPPPSSNNQKHLADKYQGRELSLMNLEKNKQVIEKIDREAFRRGLKRVSKMASFFSKGAVRAIEKRAAKNKIQHFDLKVLELELELFARAGVGLVTLEGIGVLELFLIKREESKGVM